MLKDRERTIDTLLYATSITADTDNLSTLAIAKAYINIVNILNNCVDEDSLGAVWTELESIEENLSLALKEI